MTEEKKEIIENADWFLQDFVNMVNGNEFGFGITLNVGGFLVSGQVVSGHKYFEGFANEFAKNFEDTELSENVKKSYSKYGEIYTKEKEDKEDLPRPNYIHLENAKFYNTNGQPIPNNRGVWWRGRLSEVDGFLLGALSAENAQQ